MLMVLIYFFSQNIFECRNALINLKRHRENKENRRSVIKL